MSLGRAPDHEDLYLGPAVKQAATSLANVLGQDLGTSEDGCFRIARRVAPDHVISTVDPEARHGHKTAARNFDGYKGHIATDPDSEIIVSTAVTAGNVGDAQPAAAMIEDVIALASASDGGDSVEAYGDSSYGTADLVERLEHAGRAAPRARRAMEATSSPSDRASLEHACHRARADARARGHLPVATPERELLSQDLSSLLYG